MWLRASFVSPTVVPVVQLVSLALSSCCLFCVVCSDFVTNCNSLQLRHTWKGSPKGGSILTADVLELRNKGDGAENSSRFLATAGHADGGKIRFWTLPPSFIFSNDEDRGQKEIELKNLKCESATIHNGSVFCLSLSTPNLEDRDQGSNPDSIWLVSGSFDRSASIHLVRKTTEDDLSDQGQIALQTLGSLPEHTGWVRGVKAILLSNRPEEEIYDAKRMCSNSVYMLSIGCNLVNVWTFSSRSTHDLPINRILRIARLDAGPSPDDDPAEEFRRHDILAIEIISVDRGHCACNDMWLVAGLVDGTIRVFELRWEDWFRLQASGISPYEPTGSCALPAPNSGDEGDVTDDSPIISIAAHDGRVTAIHAIPDTTDFLTVGYDSKWIYWRLEDPSPNSSEPQLAKLKEGYVSGTKDPDKLHDRICSSAVVMLDNDQGKECIEGSAMMLYTGTTSGSLYRTKLSSSVGFQDETAVLWESEAGDEGCYVSALTTMTASGNAKKHSIFACRSDGLVMLFE